MKKFEYSKLLPLLVGGLSLVFSTATVVVAILGGDAGAVANIALAYIGILGATTSGYLWKAQAENKVKIKIGMMKQIKDINGEPVDLESITNALKE